MYAFVDSCSIMEYVLTKSTIIITINIMLFSSLIDFVNSEHIAYYKSIVCTRVPYIHTYLKVIENLSFEHSSLKITILCTQFDCMQFTIFYNSFSLRCKNFYNSIIMYKYYLVLFCYKCNRKSEVT